MLEGEESEKVECGEPNEVYSQESIISLLSPVSWLQMDEVRLTSDNNSSRARTKRSEKMIKELTYGMFETRDLHLRNKKTK
ncbi:DRG-like OBG family GTPase [Cryptosporidium felis]|nr:DRG-like OBG family GTPase [Cryptosporidium felis]